LNTPLLPVNPWLDVPQALLERAASVRLACFDVDGVLTDGRLWYGPQGETLKVFHVHDGMGLKLLLDAGIEVAVVTARRSAVVTSRMTELGISRVHQGVADKLECVKGIIAELGCDLAAVAFIGDDLPDRDAMCAVGLAIAVSNARAPVREIAHWVTSAHGGNGAVREVCDLLLFANSPQPPARRVADGTIA